MNTNDLKIFEAVVSNGSFTKAAEAMYTVQSNVTARIKGLEEEFGIALFTRSSRKVALTPAGETFMYYCKQINTMIEEAKREMKNVAQVSGPLKLGCIETTMALKMPEVMTQFTEDYPEVNLEFKSGMQENLINDLLNYRLDVAFLSTPIHSKELQQVVVKEEQLVIVTSGKTDKLTDILSSHALKIIVFDEGCIFRSRLESWLGSKGIIQYKSIVLNSIEGIVNFVEAGFGISILPTEVINHYYSGRKLNVFPINKELGTMTTTLVFRNDIPKTKALKAFVDMYLNPII